MRAIDGWTLVLGATTIAVAGCGSAKKPTNGEGTGQIKFALTSMTDGATYALVNANFAITRFQPPPTLDDPGALRLPATDSTAGDLTVPNLEVRRYAVALQDGWQLERLDSPTSLVPIEATLQSANPVNVSVFRGQTTFVTFQFQSTGIPITFGPGSIDIGVGVGTCDPAPPPGVELNVVANPGFETSTLGWSSDFGGVAQSNVSHCGRHSGTSSDGLLRYDLPDPTDAAT
jgi:hypothetical protein